MPRFDNPIKIIFSLSLISEANCVRAPLVNSKNGLPPKVLKFMLVVRPVWALAPVAPAGP